MKIEKAHSKYFQKSKAFLYPILGIKKTLTFEPEECYLSWLNKYSIKDYKLIVVYKNYKSKDWNKYLANILMTNNFFENFFLSEDSSSVILVFDLHCIRNDYDNVINGKYSKLSKIVVDCIRDYYKYNSPEWAYMEGFLFPEKHIATYSKILDVEEKHIRVTGELCDLPNLEKETLKLKLNGTNNDVDKLNMEHRKDFQTDIN